MAKTTLLAIVQDILSDSDADPVNSISDTVESDQAARVVRTVYDTIVDDFDIEYHNQIIQLDATSSATPNVMTRPEGVHSIEWVKYDKRNAAADDQAYQRVTWKEPEDFITLVSSRATSDSTVTAVTLDSGHIIPVRNDIPPTFWTLLEGYDDMVFDAYNVTLETNLQASKSLAYGVIKPVLALSDAALPDLPKNLAGLLKSRARSLYFDLYKDGVPREIDKLTRKAEIRSMRKSRITKNLRPNQTGQNYGRKRR